MPSGLMPTYEYRPPKRPTTTPALLRTCSSRRARLFEGGTYFRVREPGLPGNNITIEVFQYEAPTSLSTGEAYCIVTNRNLKFDENVTGPVKTSILDLSGTYADLWQVDQLNTVTPRARKYSISLRIAFKRQEGVPYDLDADPDNEVTMTELGRFTLDKLFTADKLSVKTASDGSPLTSGSRIFIAPRTRIYKLSVVQIDPPADPPGGVITYGWDIADLRAQVNANDPWIEMLERSGPTDDGMGGPPIPNPNPNDYQDEGTDADALTPFRSEERRVGKECP